MCRVKSLPVTGVFEDVTCVWSHVTASDWSVSGLTCVWSHVTASVWSV